MAARFLSQAGIVGVGTLASRITGFIRDIMVAALLGAGPFAEIFVIAFRLPNLFRRLFAEGAFNSAFVPLYMQAYKQKGHLAARQFAAQICVILLTGLVVFTALAQLFMPQLVAALAAGFVGEPDKFALAVHYSRISFFYLIFMSLLSLFAAMLNAQGRFFASSFAPIMLNLVLIAAMGLAVILGVTQVATMLAYLIFGVVLGGLAQFFFVWIAALRAGLGFHLPRPRLTPNIKRMFTLFVPGVLAAGTLQINLLIGTSIATLQPGAAAWLYYADRLYQLPMGIIGLTLSVVLLPELSRRVAANDIVGAKSTQNLAVLAAMALTLPAAGGLVVLAQPIVTLLFERGAFLPSDTQATSVAIQLFCLGLPAFVAVRVLQPAFFARQDMRTPFIDSAVGAGFNIIVSISFFPIYGYAAIAAATGLAGWVTLSLMLIRLHRRDMWRMHRGLLWRLLALLLAALLMALALLWLGTKLPMPSHFIGLIKYLMVMIGGGFILFVGLAWLLGGIRWRDLSDLRTRP
ncbi:MAG: murein biosynthesis integral membrane protein MurJ [Parvibaculales bacterium]